MKKAIKNQAIGSETRRATSQLIRLIKSQRDDSSQFLEIIQNANIRDINAALYAQRMEPIETLAIEYAKPKYLKMILARTPEAANLQTAETALAGALTSAIYAVQPGKRRIKQKMEIFRLLFDLGANPLAANRHNISPLVTALHFRNDRACKILFEQAKKSHLSRLLELEVVHKEIIVSRNPQYLMDLISISDHKGEKLPNIVALIDHCIYACLRNRSSLDKIKPIFERLLGYGPDLNNETDRDYCILSSAFLSYSPESETRKHLPYFVGKLLKHGAIPNSSTFRPPLVTAAAQINSAANKYQPIRQAMKEMLRHGANPNSADRSGRTALSMVAQTGDIEAAKLLLEAGTRIDQADKSGNTVLHHACRPNGSLKMLELLLQRGAKKMVNLPNHDGVKPLGRLLQIRSNSDRSNQIRMLIKHGADPNACTLKYDEFELPLIDYAMRPNASGTTTYKAIKHIDALLDGGSNPPSTDSMKTFMWCPKHMESWWENLFRIHMPSTGKDGDTPLHAAALYTKNKLVEIMLPYVSNPMEKNKAGMTAADVAENKYKEYKDPKAVEIKSMIEREYLRRQTLKHSQLKDPNHDAIGL